MGKNNGETKKSNAIKETITIRIMFGVYFIVLGASVLLRWIRFGTNPVRYFMGDPVFSIVLLLPALFFVIMLFAGMLSTKKRKSDDSTKEE